MALLTGILLWLHIFGAVGWLGAAMVFGMLIGPLLPKVSPSTRGELVVKLFPKYVRYVELMGVYTGIVGVALVFAYSGGDMSIMAPTSQFGLFISTGALLAIVTLGLAFGFIGPNVHRLVRLTEEAMKNPAAPSPEIMNVARRVRVGATAGLVLLTLVLVCMVAAVS